MIPKSDTIDAIRRLNPTAKPDFLAEFSNNELAEYLDRLTGSAYARPICRVVDLLEMEERNGVEDSPVSGSPRRPTVINVGGTFQADPEGE